MINQKKGMVSPKTILSFVGVGVVILLIAFFLFSASFRVYALSIVGLAIGVGGLYINNKDKSFKEGYVFNYIMIILLLISSSFLIYQSQVQASYDNVELIGGFEYAYLGCLPAEGGEVISDPIYAGTDGKVTIFAPENSVTYDVLLSYPDLNFFSYQYRMLFSVCDDNGENCGYEQVANINFDFDDLPDSRYRLLSGISSSDTVKIEFQKSLIGLTWKADDTNRGFLELEYAPYVLYRTDARNSGRTVINSQGCDMPYEADIFGGIISSDTSKYQEFEIIDKLNPNQYFNYITAISPVFVDGSVVGDYKGEQGYCVAGGNTATIYGLWEVTTENQGTYKIVDSSNVLGYEECCPNVNYGTLQQCVDYKLENIQYETEYDEEGNIVSATSDVYCSLLYPLPTGKQIYTNKISFEWDCVDNVGVMTGFQEEECTLSEDCGENEVCSNFQCVVAGTTSTLDDKIIEQNEGNM